MSDDNNDRQYGPSYKIFLAHPKQDSRKILSAFLVKLGHEVSGEAKTCAEILIECAINPPDIIVTGLAFPDGDGIETLISVSDRQPVPAIVITAKADIEKVEHAMDDHVMAYLIDPVTSDDLKPTIHVVKRRFDQMEELKEEVENLQERLDARKLLDRAKGLLMKHKEISEEEAYLEIREMATKNQMKLAKIATIIIESY